MSGLPLCEFVNRRTLGMVAMSHQIRELEHVWIRMPDGVRLAARVWMPVQQGAYPAILEYIPYRRRDLVRARDEQNHPYFAEHGYVCLRVDMRGSGDSEGHMPDMYNSAELADARHLIDWIAAQPWCNGQVGMFGTSWGGTASLQAAVRAPNALKAVLANCATIDRFEDDIHWMGGCLLTDTIEWGATLPAILAAPPDAATVGEGWWRQWQQRLEQLTFPMQQWLGHGTRGIYWRQGSVRFAAHALSCPILAIGGWSDRYSNSVMPLVQQRPDICWGIVGPWGHHYPDQGEPGPAIGFQQLALQWWDHWLKGEGESVPQWPRLRLWRRQFDPPVDRLRQRNGDWIQFDDTDHEQERALFIGNGSLSQKRVTDTKGVHIPSSGVHGMAAGDTGYFGRVGGLPLDQATEDAESLCFDAQPLELALDIVGRVRIELDISSQQTPGLLVCRLCDVAPDRQSQLICRGVFNLALDEMLDNQLPHQPGDVRQITLRLPTTAYRLQPGHTLRLSLAGSYWPLVWPVNGDALVHGGVVRIPLQPDDMRPLRAQFPDVLDLPADKRWRRQADGLLERSCQQLDGGGVLYQWHQPATTTSFLDTESSVTTQTKATYTLPAPDQASPACRVDHQIEIRRPDGVAQLRSSAEVTGELKDIKISGSLSISWNSAEVYSRHWDDY